MRRPHAGDPTHQERCIRAFFSTKLSANTMACAKSTGLPSADNFVALEHSSIPSSMFAECCQMLIEFLRGPYSMYGFVRSLVLAIPYSYCCCTGHLSHFSPFACSIRIGLPYSESLVDRTLLEVSGTVLAARLALKFGLVCNLAGGTHHAHKGFGSGCVFSVLAVVSSGGSCGRLPRQVVGGVDHTIAVMQQ